MNIATVFEETVYRRPDHPALVFKGEKYSYRRLNEAINRLANGLRKLGMKKGDTLAILLPNSHLGVFSFYAGLKVGAISVCLNPMLKGKELKTILMNSKAKVFITHFDCFKSLKPGLKDLKDLKEILLIDGPEEMEGVLSFGWVAGDSSSEFVALDVEADDPAIIIYTSGTTGLPKGALFTHDGLLTCIDGLMLLLGELSNDDRLLSVVPLSSSLSIAGVMIPGFLKGATVYLHERFDPKDYVTAIRENKITIFMAVPTIYFELNALPGLNEKDLQSVRFAGSSGAPLPPEVRRQFEKRVGKEITQFYGNTESTRLLVSDPMNGERRPESIGKALPDVALKILDPGGREVPIGEAGEVCARFPGGMIAYWNNPKETGNALQNGWLHTGDIGRLDKDGFLYLLDRKSDMMIVGGFNVFPAEIENILHMDPRVKEAAIVGMTDERLGEIPMAFVVLKKGVQATGEELIEIARKKLAKYKAPRKIQFVEDIPKNPAGKVLKRVLRERYRLP